MEENEAIIGHVRARRLKVQPCLEKRVVRPNTHMHAKASLIARTEGLDYALDMQLDNGAFFVVDEVILATGLAGIR